ARELLEVLALVVAFRADRHAIEYLHVKFHQTFPIVGDEIGVGVTDGAHKFRRPNFESRRNDEGRNPNAQTPRSPSSGVAASFEIRHSTFCRGQVDKKTLTVNTWATNWTAMNYRNLLPTAGVASFVALAV